MKESRVCLADSGKLQNEKKTTYCEFHFQAADAAKTKRHAAIILIQNGLLWFQIITFKRFNQIGHGDIKWC